MKHQPQIQHYFIITNKTDKEITGAQVAEFKY